jgi:hypothetical protein
MATWRDYDGKSIGRARVMAEVPVSDGSTALRIENFWMDERGVLVNDFAIMPHIPDEWRGAAQPAAFQSGVLAMRYAEIDGGVPELLFVTVNGIYRYAPWLRAAGGTNPGLELQRYYEGNSLVTPAPQGSTQYPPQVEVFGNRFYITFCDGGQAWVWDRHRLRPLGFTQRPPPPQVEGPQRLSSTEPNAGGWTVRGRIGTLESDWTRVDAPGGDYEVVGGIDNGRWQYAVVWEGPDGGYSSTSAPGGIATIRQRTSESPGGAVSALFENLRRRFRLFDIGLGPVGTAARILLRTRNLDRLPSGDFGEFHFLHRLPSNQSAQWVDDIPDEELGAPWQHRETTPQGIYFLRNFSGSMWYLRTDGHPSRLWWSEQTSVVGPTPESILSGHWRDVFPNTGAITGSIETRLEGQDAPVLLVFKDGATHYVTGQYPDWQFGTLHSRAGLAGPNLVQAVPDGTLLWFGAGTFWSMTPQGQVQDIGAAIRTTLGTVNSSLARKGSSWVDRRAGEVVFVLPTDDAANPGTQFVWDYRVQGWRLRTDVEVTAAEVVDDTVLLGGVWDSTTTTWAYGVGYTGYAFTQPTATFMTGWVSLSEDGPGLPTARHNVHLVVQGEEKYSGNAALSTFKDWDADTAVDADLTVPRAHPDDDEVPFYGSAEYDTDVYRTERTYFAETPADVPNHTVLAVSISTAAPMGLVDIFTYGPAIAGPGSRTPTDQT